MLDVVLHAGSDHPNLLWAVAAAVLSFAGGTGAGLWLARKTGFGSDAPADAVEE